MTMLYIIRHAWAGDRDEQRYPDDAQRPLTPGGRKRFRACIKKLADRGFAPTIVATSPLVRCQQTAAVVCEIVAGCLTPDERPELAPGGELAPLVAWSAARQSAGADQIAWVGHAPDVGEITAQLIGDGAGAIDFSKGAVAAVEFDGPIALGAGVLRWLATAKLLGE